MTVRILSIDGGGVRGMIPAVVIAAVEKAAGRPAWDLFDLIAGTSTGGIIALGLSHPAKRLTGEEIVAFYREKARTIFYRGWWRALASLGSLSDQKYDSGPIATLLKAQFGEDVFLSALPGNPGGGPELIVTAYDLQEREPALFKSWRARGDRWDCTKEEDKAGKDFPLWQIARATTAAPTYFEPFRAVARSGRTRALIDGGVYANNPALVAYVAARRIFPRATDMLMVSLGTGEDRHPIAFGKAVDWGLIEWARPLFKVLLGASSDAVDYQLRELMQEQYWRITKNFDGGVGHAALQVIDDASARNLAALERFAHTVVEEHKDAIAHVAARLAALPRAQAGP
jgi:patatin-like phospholipase/acyl hydrolase